MNEREKRQLRNVFVFWFIIYALLLLFVVWCYNNPLPVNPYTGH